MNLSSAKERRALILKQLETKEEVLVSELSKETGISEVTIRKDLTILQNRKLLIRTRGGAMRKPIENLNEDTAITKKRMFNFREKERIGIEATKLIKEGDYIMLDSGTTTMEIAKNLHKFHNLHIVTNALNIAICTLRPPKLHRVQTLPRRGLLLLRKRHLYPEPRRSASQPTHDSAGFTGDRSL